MRKLLLLLLLLLLTTLLLPLITFSQAWINNLPQDKLKSNKVTFFEMQKAFDDYWEEYNVDNKGYYKNADGVKTKAAGWKQFNRWAWNMEGQINPETGKLPVKTAQQVYSEFEKLSPNQKKSKSANWKVLGPSSTPNPGYAGVGRINCIAFHPIDTNTYWIGAPAGGLWVTTDDGANWTCLTDDNSVLGISDIIIPSDYEASKTIYIATGDRDGWDNNSIGVLKSTDGGLTWNNTSLAFSLADRRMVNRLLIDPNDVNTILAATSIGVYKTTDGGATWSTRLTSYDFIDMEYKPSNFDTLYGSTENGSIYVSTNSGENWIRTHSSTTANRTELAVTQDNSNIVYAVLAGSDNGLYGVYRSNNSGSSFTKVLNGTTKNLLGWDSDGQDNGGQGWYDLTIAASPTDSNTVVVGGVNSWRSTDGGKNWSVITHWWGQSGVQAVHADKHNLTYRNNGDLFECNDGGIYYSDNNGTDFSDKTNGIIISQMYKLGVSQTHANEVITGLQDNGTKLYANGTWDDVKGGDGMECMIDYTNKNIQYGSYVYGQISITKNHWSSAEAIEPYAAGNGAWVTPYIIDPDDNNTIYAGYSNVWKSSNQGDSWTQISTMSSYNKLRSMAISPSHPFTLYVADNTHIWKTTDGGASWSDITGSLPISYGYIKYITIKDDDENTLWVAISGYNNRGVYESTNGGSTWTNISSGLPNLPAYSIVQDTQINNEVFLYVGTELGIYLKKGNTDWTEYNTGLPNVKIGELEIYYDKTNSENSKLRAATYGRGLWESNLFIPKPPVAEFSAKPTTTNVGGLIDFTDLSLNEPTEWIWSFEQVTPTTFEEQNPSIIYDSIGVHDVTLIVVNSAGRDTIIKKDFITILPSEIPTAAFTANKTLINIGETVQFTDTSKGVPTSWEWSFTGGTPSTSVDKDPQVKYDNTGSYSVSLIATNSEGSNTSSKTEYITVLPLPIADFDADTLSGAYPFTVNFTNTSTNSETYIWHFGDGETSTDKSPTHVYTKLGTYTVSLVASSSIASDTKTKSNYITVNWPIPVANFEAAPLSGIDPLLVTFTDKSIDAQTWLWDFGDNTTSEEQNTTHSFTKGTYTVSLLVTNPSGDNSITENNLIIVEPNSLPEDYKNNLKVYPNPVADIISIELLNENNKKVDIELYDLSGKLVKKIVPTINTVIKQQVNIEHLDAGNYILKITIDSDIIVLNIIKE